MKVKYTLKNNGYDFISDDADGNICLCTHGLQRVFPGLLPAGTLELIVATSRQHKKGEVKVITTTFKDHSVEIKGFRQRIWDFSFKNVIGGDLQRDIYSKNNTLYVQLKKIA